MPDLDKARLFRLQCRLRGVPIWRRCITRGRYQAAGAAAQVRSECTRRVPKIKSHNALEPGPRHLVRSRAALAAARVGTLATSLSHKRYGAGTADPALK